jgi:K+-transporting ATPase ATPase C chain
MLIGQVFMRPEYFHGRPSSAGAGYDGAASGASNLGPTSARLMLGEVEDGKVVFDGIRLRVLRYCLENGIGFTTSEPLDRFRRSDGTLDAVKLIEAFRDPGHALTITPAQPLPADAVTGSGSGLDPDISPANARLQAPRVARARGVAVAKIARLIARYTQAPTFGLLGDARVNLLALNLALDRR